MIKVQWQTLNSKKWRNFWLDTKVTQRTFSRAQKVLKGMNKAHPDYIGRIVIRVKAGQQNATV